METDEVFVPYLRSEMKLPPKEVAHKQDYDEILSESPLYTLAWVLVMQIFGHRECHPFRSEKPWLIVMLYRYLPHVCTLRDDIIIDCLTYGYSWNQMGSRRFPKGTSVS